MKNLKFKVISSLIATALVIPGTVFAEGTSAGTSKFGNGLINEQQQLQVVQERQQFKAGMSQKKDTIKKNHETNENLRKEASDKKAAVKSAINDIKQSKKQLSPEDLNKLEAQLKVVQGDISTLEATKGTVKQAFEQFKTDVKNNNYDAAASQLDSIIAIQNTRTSGLTKLNADLDSIISILQSASASSTADSLKAGA